MDDAVQSVLGEKMRRIIAIRFLAGFRGTRVIAADRHTVITHELRSVCGIDTPGIQVVDGGNVYWAPISSIGYLKEEPFAEGADGEEDLEFEPLSGGAEGVSSEE